jgi:signal transduction histidine kinase
MKTQRPAYSLMRVLFGSMVLLATALFIIAQLMDGGPPAVTTFGVHKGFVAWLWEYRFAVLMIATTTAAIWLTLHLALRPMRRLSEKAGVIGPDNLHERLPLANAPAEIAPLVSAFNLSLERLETAWAAQRAFSASAAHELRTPLASLRAEVESLFPAQERRVVTAEFDRLARLIEQLLILAEADQDHLTRKDPFDVVALARDTAMEVAPKIILQGREIGFDTEIEHWECLGDRLLAGVAIRNLLENAVKHTAEGAKISVNVDSEGVVTVKDDGPGIPPEFEGRLFERFSKSDRSSAGAGLGLSIVSRIMALHSGRVWFERQDIGAAFSLAFPPVSSTFSADTASFQQFRKD